MTRIRSFAVFASLFLASPALADSPITSSDEPAVSRDTAIESTATTPERRLTTRERWRGKPYLSSRRAAPGALVTNHIDLRSEVLNQALPIQTPFNGGSVF
ncbi:MAG: hypothetical protein CL910_15580 [Deltaproteobacteria bacterium]|jgi:hypothetical protein|nr:hypothetical protein [Deltaproteobacteria bacterium]